jgi:hypothetical protein
MDQIHIPVAVRYPSLMQDFEKLGAFYLGRAFDLEKGQPKDELVLYDSSDLTTHAVIVGMTGSGKTGLWLGLLEEAAIDGIPAIAIDPKGDVGNLLLTFPELRPDDFRPWVDVEEAARAGKSRRVGGRVGGRDVAKRASASGDRTARVSPACALPARRPSTRLAARRDVDSLSCARSLPRRRRRGRTRRRCASARRRRSRGLLALLGIEADPLRSREHILLATLVERAWQAGRAVDLTSLIRDIQSPPIERVGVLDLESFFPARDRFALATQLNNVLASPGFAAWLEGDALDVGKLLHTTDGRPRVSILSIAHLSDQERMFFVTLLLGEIIAWMRSQPGTSSLRAILYMDEVFGYLPPSANPPSKTPLLTLLKQARAFGLGTVLATQNPVDLDYKALTNAGTWLVGRLQAQRDKDRLLDGLEGASAAAGRALDRAEDRRASCRALPKRVFLMHDVHEDAPVVMQTRWTLSYLRGPLTREQIRTLSGGQQVRGAGGTGRPHARRRLAVSAEVSRREAPSGPLLPPDVEEVFVGAGTAYRPTARSPRPASITCNAAAGMDAWRTVALLAELPASGSDIAWDRRAALARGAVTRERTSRRRDVPAAAGVRRARGELQNLAEGGHEPLPGPPARSPLWRCAELKETSRPDESEGDFRARPRARLPRAARRGRRRSLRQRFAPKLAALEEQVRQAEGRVAREESQYTAAEDAGRRSPSARRCWAHCSDGRSRPSGASAARRRPCARGTRDARARGRRAGAGGRGGEARAARRAAGRVRRGGWGSGLGAGSGVAAPR